MSRVARRVSSVAIIGAVLGSSVVFGAVGAGGAVQIVTALQSWLQEVKDAKELVTLPEGAVDGDIFERAYELAEYNVSSAAIEAINETHQAIGERCDGDIRLQHVSDVFAETSKAERYLHMMNRKGMIDPFASNKGNFQQGCTEVVKCYFADEDENMEQLTYSNELITTCKDIVSSIFDTMLQRSSTLTTIQQSNYGDEFYSNADPDDAAFDLLIDVEKIGDLLFAHNDDPSEIHFYDMEMPEDYIDNDPKELTPSKVEQPNRDQEDPTKRLPPANGTRPIDTTPDEIADDPSLMPAAGPAKGIDTLGDNESGSPSSTNGGSLQNNFCVAIEPEEDTGPDMLERGIQEQEQTYEYNEALDLEGRLAVALLGRMAPELEEQYGLDEIPPPPPAGTQPDEILETTSFEEDEVAAMSDAFERCVSEHTEDGDTNLTTKRIRKTITQPTLLTSCAQQVMCQQISDESGRGMFRLKVCKVPPQGYDVTAHQPVMSIEQVVDDIKNICTSLKESGQLIEHNKTKDQLQHQLMRVNFGEKVSFSLSVGFLPLWNPVDPATLKRQQVERTTHLEDVLLNVSDRISLQERNKYVVLFDPTVHQAMLEPGTVTTAEQRAEAYDAEAAGSFPANKPDQSQLTHYANMLDEFDEFLHQNTSFRDLSNDYMHSLNEKRQATYQEFKNDSGQ